MDPAVAVGSSAQAIAYSSTTGAPSSAATTAIPRTISGSIPIRYAMPAQTPPIHPSVRVMPRLRIQSKNRVPRPEKPVRGPPYGLPGVPTGRVDSFCDMLHILPSRPDAGYRVNP